MTDTPRVRRGRRKITCTHCHQETITRHPTTGLCLWCRRDTGDKANPDQPITQRSKHELDAWLTSGGAA